MGLGAWIGLELSCEGVPFKGVPFKGNPFLGSPPREEGYEKIGHLVVRHPIYGVVCIILYMASYQLSHVLLIFLDIP